MAGSIAIKVTSESHCQAPIGLQNDGKAENTTNRNKKYKLLHFMFFVDNKIAPRW